ncbi:hypothetical protein BGZ92_006195 [Podila epicladia]|nr:hypothetical protein BGZ92_006195 [Podila epicladia]
MSSTTYWVVVKEHCSQLTSLTVDWSEIPENAPQLFWPAVSGLETLVLPRHEFWPNRDLAQHCHNPKDFPHMKHLTWCHVNGDRFDLLFVGLLKCMPVLELLHWSLFEKLPDTLTDADLVLVLGSVAPSTLRNLFIVESGAEPASFTCLKERGQFTSLEELEWRHCKDIHAAKG